MDKATFDRLISSPDSISGAEVELLDELVRTFPYCQSAHLLLARESQQKKSMLYPHKLKRAATYILDRKILHKLLLPSAKQAINEVNEEIAPLATVSARVNEPEVYTPVLQPDVVIPSQSEPESLLAVRELPVLPSTEPEKEAIEPSPPATISTLSNLALLQELEENLRMVRDRRDHGYYPDKKEVTNSPLPQDNKEIEVAHPLPEVIRAKPFEEFSIPDNFTPLPPASPKNESRLEEELDSKRNNEYTTHTVDLLLSYLEKTHSAHQEDKKSINQWEVIDKFLDTAPQISRSQPLPIVKEENKDLSIHSIALTGELVTENYALILVKQNKIEKAREVYHKLMLKYPTKSAYFAGKLNELDSR